MTLSDTLKQLDCSEAEIATFLALAKDGKGKSVLLLSRLLNIPRPTIYVHLKLLMEKGLVRRGIDEGGSIFYIESPQAVGQLFKEKAAAVSDSGKRFLELWEEHGSSEQYQSKFFLHTTTKAAENIFRDVLHSRDHESLWVWPIVEMMQVVSETAFSHFYQERVRRGIHARVIWPKKRTLDVTKIEKVFGSLDPKESLRQIRIAPKDIDTTLGYAVYGNKVAFISSQREHYGFIIDSKELADLHRSQFEHLWKESVPMKK
jgi:HTH-type transcriptional regulator, sugar sensing transcriptional regulator